jgi:hypothetical protein
MVITEKEWKQSTPDTQTYCLVHQGDPLEEWCLFDMPLFVYSLRNSSPNVKVTFTVLSTVFNSLKGNRSCTGDKGSGNDSRPVPAEQVEDE